MDNERSPSVASTQVQPGPSRRGPRGPYKKIANVNTISETLEPDGRLPGYKDGLGVFPAGSHWASLMLTLKLKGSSLSDLLALVPWLTVTIGKRYRTKKERLRKEKGGPPYRADGSVDFAESMHHPHHLYDVIPAPHDS